MEGQDMQDAVVPRPAPGLLEACASRRQIVVRQTLYCTTETTVNKT